ncbi:MAG TPA: DUF5719 family protein [Thermoanaerobaculia bacterium]|nr:DUF5719 family protein [Thermoanaerobaculia bacterium]
MKLAALLILIAAPLSAAYSARDVVLPIAGRAGGADGRLYLTALWITNPSERDAVEAKLTFHPADDKLPPHASSLHLNAGETRVLDPLDENGLGALRIEATRDVVATARVYSQGMATSFAAMPVQFAIGNGESATLQGVAPAAGRYKIYFAEVSGNPLDISVSLVDARGATLGTKRMYIDRDRQVTSDVGDLFPQFTAGTATLRIEGVNGGGRIVVAGAQNSTPFEMSFTTTPRDRLGLWEAIAYIAVAAAAAAALFIRR